MEHTADNIKSQELILDYPLVWEYKIVAAADVNIENIAANLLGEKKYKLKISKESEKGTYKSYALKLEVADDEERRNIFESLRKHAEIKFVL